MSETKIVSINNIFKINNNKANNRKHRNYGIDLLRIFSMINIINLHINLRTGMTIKQDNIKFKNIWRLETFSYFAVDCFGLISGIVGFNKCKFSNLIYLWFISSFYSVSKHLYLFINNNIDLTRLVLSFFPIIIKFHWYVNAYFIMYLFLPFINHGIELLNVKSFRILVIFYIFFFSIYYIISALFTKPDFNFLIGGYSSSWLTILYIIGSYFGKYKLKSTINKNNSLIKFFHLINYIGFSFLSSEIYFRTGKRFLISYISPTILFQALSLVMIFYSIHINNLYLIKVIKFITPLVFSSTLIHSTVFTLKFKFVLSFFKTIREFNNDFLFVKIYIMSLLFFILCILIDYFRLLLFQLLKIREFCLFIENFFPKAINKLLTFIKIIY